MNEIICPNCHKAFKVDEAGFADIVKQVRDHQFEEELQNRLNLAEKEKESAVKLAEATIKNSLQQQLAQKDAALAKLKSDAAIELSQKLSQKDNELLQLKTQIHKSQMYIRVRHTIIRIPTVWSHTKINLLFVHVHLAAGSQCSCLLLF